MSFIVRILRSPQVATLKDPKFWKESAKQAKPLLSELRPPTPSELPAAVKGIVNLVKHGNIRELTVKEALRKGLVGVEIACWFFVGEIIGKGTLIGYQV